jgi:hypothetical protein
MDPILDFKVGASVNGDKQNIWRKKFLYKIIWVTQCCIDALFGAVYAVCLRLTLSLAAPFAPPPCLEALGLIGPRKKEKKTGFDDFS